MNITELLLQLVALPSSGQRWIKAGLIKRKPNLRQVWLTLQNNRALPAKYAQKMCAILLKSFSQTYAMASYQAYFVTHYDSVLGLPTVPCWAGEDHTQSNLVKPTGWTEALANTWNRARADRFAFFAEESIVLCRWPRFEWEERIQFRPWTLRLSEDRLWLTAQWRTAPAAS